MRIVLAAGNNSFSLILKKVEYFLAAWKNVKIALFWYISLFLFMYLT